MITVFAGAGASRALDYPTTGEFFARGKGRGLQKDVVYVQSRKYLQKEVLDVEDALRLLYPFAALHSTPTGKFIFPHLGSNWIASIPEFVQKTNKVCFDHYGRRPPEDNVRKLYAPLLEFCGWQNQECLCLQPIMIP